MKNKIKTHLTISIFAGLMLIGGLVSGLRGREHFFKGVATIQDAEASVLTADLESTPDAAPDFDAIKKANLERVANEENAYVATATSDAPELFVSTSVSSSATWDLPPAPQFTVVASVEAEPVKSGGAPSVVIPTAPIIVTSTPTVGDPVTAGIPKVAAEAATTCESTNKFTYTGPDRPGLLYGMCIECTTREYIMGNGSCPK